MFVVTNSSSLCECNSCLTPVFLHISLHGTNWITCCALDLPWYTLTIIMVLLSVSFRDVCCVVNSPHHHWNLQTVILSTHQLSTCLITNTNTTDPNICCRNNGQGILRGVDLRGETNWRRIHDGYFDGITKKLLPLQEYLDFIFDNKKCRLVGSRKE